MEAAQSPSQQLNIVEQRLKKFSIKFPKRNGFRCFNRALEILASLLEPRLQNPPPKTHLLKPLQNPYNLPLKLRQMPKPSQHLKKLVDASPTGQKHTRLLEWFRMLEI